MPALASSTLAWRIGIDASSPASNKPVPTIVRSIPMRPGRDGPVTPRRRTPTNPMMTSRWKAAYATETGIWAVLDHG
jgi:hypothetical protein